MAIQRLLALISGKQTEYVPLQTSAGSGSAGAIPALNAAGQIDVTMMPTGVGPDTVSLPATEAIAAGAFVNIWSSSGTPSVRNADGSTTGKQADGFVLAAVTSGGTAIVYLSGVNTAVSGQTAGLVYLSDTTVGGTMTAGATTAGHTFQQIGMAVSATSIQFDPQQPIVRA